MKFNQAVCPFFSKVRSVAGAACGSALQNWPREKVPLEDAFQLTSAVWIWDEPSLSCFTFSNVTDDLLLQVALSVPAMSFYI